MAMFQYQAFAQPLLPPTEDALEISGTFLGTVNGMPMNVTFTLIGERRNRPALRVQTQTLPAGSTGVPYSVRLRATGGIEPYTWAIVSGTLPAGLNLVGDTITGTPLLAASGTIVVRVTDAAPAPATDDSAALALVIVGAPDLIITTASPLPSAVAGVAYDTALQATGGTPPYTWSALDPLPSGLTLVAATGHLIGTPLTPGLASFRVRVTDAGLVTAEAPLALSVQSAVATLTVTPPPTQTVQTSGSTVAVFYPPATTTGGVAPITLAYSHPSGSTFPLGTTTVLVTATSSDGQTATATFAVVVQVAALPAVQSFVRLGSSPTGAATVSWRITISQPVTGVTTTAFSLAATGITGASIQSLTGSGAVYVVTATTGSGDGTLGLNLSNPAGIVNSSGQPLAGAAIGPVYAIDHDVASATLLSPSDLTYLGYYDVQPNGFAIFSVSTSWRLRYVGSDLRIIGATGNGDFGAPSAIEFSIANLVAGGTLNQPPLTNSWSGVDLFAGNYTSSHHVGLWIDPDDPNVLWSTTALDYASSGTGIPVPTHLYYRTILDNGQVTNVVGPISLEGVGMRNMFGGFAKIPAYFQSLYGVGPMLGGWGGYTSLANNESPCAFGPAMFAFPRLTDYIAPTTIPAAQVRTLANQASSNANGSLDWWNGTGATVPSSFDRGYRLPGFHRNYLDGGAIPGENPHGTGMEVDVVGTVVTFSSSGPQWRNAYSGTAVGGTSTTVRLATDASATDGDYVNFFGRPLGTIHVHIYAGTGAGQWNHLVGYTGATREAQVRNPWVVIPDATSQLRIGFCGTQDAYFLDARHMFWAGYTVPIDGVATAFHPVATIDGESCLIASIDSAFQLTLSAPPSGNKSGVDFLSAGTKPVHDRCDLMHWTNVSNPLLGAPTDGLARWTWSDSYHSSGVWIKGSNKEGIVCLFAGVRGKTWYSNSNMQNEGHVQEWHIFNPQHLGECALGTRAPWNVRPTHLAEAVPLSAEAQQAWDDEVASTGIQYSGSSIWGQYHSIDYDERTGKLYAFSALIPYRDRMRISVFQVNA